MALFSDGTVSTVADLTAQDSSVLDVAQTEGINLTQKLELARGEVGLELSSCLERSRSSYSQFGQPPLTLANVAVTAPLQVWHTFRTLAAVYRDAYFSQLNARYSAKWQAFEKLARKAMLDALEAGVGMVWDPLPQGGEPALSTDPGPGAGGVFYAAVAFVNAAGEEGLASPVLDLTVPAGNLLVITAGTAPANATGWNAYAGVDPGALALLNATPLTPGTSFTWTPGIVGGRGPGAGQTPNMLRMLSRIWQRG